MRIEAVIPVYRPDEKLLRLLEGLSSQRAEVAAVHLVNTQKDLFDAFLQTQDMTEEAFLRSFPQVDLLHIEKKDFDHGATRNLGAGRCRKDADVILFMTQDAVPADENLTENLTAPMKEDALLAACCARQLAAPGADAAERISRQFNYPEVSRTKSQEDFEALGIKTYFCSNVCAAYRASIFWALGSFPSPMIFNEDMVFAGRALQAGYRIRYCADARVYHSHSYGPMQQFHRNFDLGVSQAQHPEIFSGTKSEGEGMRYVKAVLRTMRTEHGLSRAPAFLVCCAFRYLGYRKGKNYTKLSQKKILRYTGNRGFWDIWWRLHPQD
ncbi:MAG: glycosyltransferase family 2 protein [Lachnospiraceae bacterium]